MLRPRDTATRECRALDGLWRFALDREELPHGREMPVPASYNDVYPDPELRGHVGEAWYEATFRVPRAWDGRRIVLRFDSATHRAVVWVNGSQVAEHDGGYTPFEADITELVTSD